MYRKNLLLPIILGVTIIPSSFTQMIGDLTRFKPFLDVNAEELASDWFVNDRFRSEIAYDLNTYYGYSGLTADTLKKEDIANYFFNKKYNWKQNQADLLQGEAKHDLTGLEYSIGYQLMYEGIDNNFRLHIPDSLNSDSSIMIHFTNGLDGDGTNYETFSWENSTNLWNLEYIFDNPNLLNTPNIEINTLNYGSSEMPSVLIPFDKNVDDSNFTYFEILLSDKYKNNFSKLSENNSTLEINLGENYLGDVEFTNQSSNVIKYRIDIINDFYESKLVFTKIEGEYQPGTYTTTNGSLPNVDNWDELSKNTFGLYHESIDENYRFTFYGRAALLIELKGIVDIKYVDENGVDIIDGKRIRDRVNSEYEVDPENIEGYEYVYTIGEKKGYYNDKINEVTFVYKKVSNTSTTIDAPTYPEEEKLPKTSKIDNYSVYGLIGSILVLIGKQILK